ncbi:proliferating cell nuclear antigen, N-terminal domain-containing protein [Gymnopilus junonius]|uniref:DNA sliding clamp PCNA n=1 Tax=Gymnopilus junonius TaxID=109634 RepID=A0A9P5TG44_GYMJU|nr:proliferating cell nuclear antigen, N-terminal domain-containing protein [Gymnopilus junonius]
MLEAKLQEAGTLKKLLDSIKELVTDANFECNEEAIVLQAMDNSHFSAAAFKRYRCDRPMPLGVNLTSLNKVLRCAKDDDICTLKAADEADVLNLVYEAKNSDRIAEYDMKLMDIDADTLQIPDTGIRRPRHPSLLRVHAHRARPLPARRSVRIEVSKEGVRFASDGEAANGSVLLRQSDGALISGTTIRPNSSAKKEKAKVKKEKGDEDVDMSHEKDDNEDGEEEEFKPVENDEEARKSKRTTRRRKKRMAAARREKKRFANGTSKPAKKPKTSKSKGKATEEDESATDVIIEMNQHVCLTFSLKYLVNFSKSATLSNKVQLMMSNDVPLLVSYDFNQGYIRYYLAPKIGED